MDGKAGKDETFAVLSAASSAVASYRLHLWTAVFVHFVVKCSHRSFHAKGHTPIKVLGSSDC